MEYGILVAEQEDPSAYQIIGAVWSLVEARELAENYFANGAENDCVVPDEFVILRRNENGFYTRREKFEL